ncbi:hypothetical protein AMECASPLE_019310, partial [Ameca splendens]
VFLACIRRAGAVGDGGILAEGFIPGVACGSAHSPRPHCPPRLQPAPGNKQGDGPTATQGLRRSSSPTDSRIRTGGKESATEHYQTSSSYFTKGKTPQSFPRSSFGSSLTWSAVKRLSATKTGCRTFQSTTTSQGSYLILKM